MSGAGEVLYVMITSPYDVIIREIKKDHPEKNKREFEDIYHLGRNLLETPAEQNHLN